MRKQQLPKNNPPAGSTDTLPPAGGFACFITFYFKSIPVHNALLDGVGCLLPGQAAGEGQRKGDGRTQRFAGNDVAVQRDGQAVYSAPAAVSLSSMPG